MEEFKSGFVSIIGKPNVGKSTLINKLINEKVSIVSPKPQTTRNKILGILNEENYQIIFIDTPGIHKAKNKLDDFMSKSINTAKKDCDLTLLVIDGSKRLLNDTLVFIEEIAQNNKTILVVNKTDLTSFEKLYPTLDILNKNKNLLDIIPISALQNKNIDVLLNRIKQELKAGVKYFNDDEYTDKTEKFMVAEIIREKALLFLNEEVPHGVAIEIASFTENEKLTEIDVDLICERDSHKQIIIGKFGEMLKKIGTSSRYDIERLLNKKVMLRIFVKVKNEWRDNNKLIKELGYSDLE